jgi:hypothetical protein
MSWLAILAIVGAGVALVSLFAVGPKGGRNVGGTRLMGAARVFLVVAALIAVALVWRARMGG